MTGAVIIGIAAGAIVVCACIAWILAGAVVAAIHWVTRGERK